MKQFSGFQRGVNLGGWLSQCIEYNEEYFNTFIQEEDIKKIASWGLDHVRLPVDNDVIEHDDGTPKLEGHKHIEDCISWCKKYGLNVILDLHKTCGFMFDQAVVKDPDKFFTDSNLQERFYSTWRELMTRYGKYKDMMAYELLNEVVNPDYATKWNEIANKAIKVIREYESDAYILVGGVMHNSVLSVTKLDRPYDDHIVFNFHCYDPICFTHQRAHWVENIDYELSYPAPIAVYEEKSRQLNQNHACNIFKNGTSEVGPAFYEKLFEDAIRYANSCDVALYCGEYGVIDMAPAKDSLRWLRDINEVFTKYGIGRALWNYKDKDFGLNEAHYDEVREDMIKVISK